MKVLPFYTSTGQRDAERVNSQDALLCPTHKCLPWQIQRSHLTSTYINEVTLIDCDGNETDVYDYFYDPIAFTGLTNSPSPFTLWATSGTTILTAAIATSALAYAYTDGFALATGASVIVEYNLTLWGGCMASLFLGAGAGTVYSASTVMAAGANFARLTASGNNAGDVRVLVKNTADVTDFMSTFPSLSYEGIKTSERTTYDFITYNGAPLSTTLPYGVYYLKVSDGNTTWYSEWFNVQNIQSQILTGYVASTYDTFTDSGPNITSAIELAGAAHARSNTFSMRTGEKFIFTYDLTLNSGELPYVGLYISSVLASNAETISIGANIVELTATGTGTADCRIVNTDATNFVLASVSLRRKAGNYVHLEYTNARDFNNGDESILYTSTGGFTQQVYLRSYENLPTHETIEVGDDKNGSFVAEKLVSKYSRSVVAYVSRALHNALRLLPLHSTVKILNEAGVEYTPTVGNINVGMDWDTFDTGTLKIVWNETNVAWTNSSDNII